MNLTTTPRATARLQFFSGFTLDDAVDIVPYLSSLGISHLYASPLLSARPGSTHCYDIIDHNTINPELGGFAALCRLVTTLRQYKMGLILDIVPNHMGVGGADNAWWQDVLEWGRASHYAEFFDIDWTPPDTSLYNKMLLPFLGAAYGEVLNNAEFKLKLNSADGSLFVEYHEHHFPISARTAAIVLHSEPIMNDVAHQFDNAAKSTNRTGAVQSARLAKSMLFKLIEKTDGMLALERCIARFDATEEGGRKRLHELLQRQHYRLSWWRAAADEINWRRFFDINTLAGVRVEIPRVFNATHDFILDLYAQGLIDGVRIDHIDGLADPRGYARKLRRTMSIAGEKRPKSAPFGKPYILVEKILNGNEHLEPAWLVDGTTGYDFMDQVSAVLHNPNGEAALSELWTNLTGRTPSFRDEENGARIQILRDNLASELNATAASLHRIARRNLETRDYTLTGIRRALTEILVNFPVYRIYAGHVGANITDNIIMDRALAAARRYFRPADIHLLDLIRHWVADATPRTLPPGQRRTERLHAKIRFQQLSAPVAAKSVEDTAFYRFGRLLSRNEVGSNPGQFSLSPAAFHTICSERAKKLPGAMLATATHDHKRGEDTRARLAVLSEIPNEWENFLTRIVRLNGIIRQEAGPSMADELMLYQMLCAGWPLELAKDDEHGVSQFVTRVAAWQEKSLREAKLNSEWAAPNEAYELACKNFLEGTLDITRPVIGEIVSFANRLGAPGAINGLAQTLLRLTTPGVPDLYQGTEFWDQSFVDPDNRRPVDYALRQKSLETPPTIDDLLAQWKNGAIKQAIIARTLAFRSELPELFAKGNYLSLNADGDRQQHILAFTRRFGKHSIIVVISRLSALIVRELPLISSEDWKNTTLALPSHQWTDVLSGKKFIAGDVPIAELLNKFPVALLHLNHEKS